MIKYTNTQVVFEEIPDEITLAINISNCQNRCVGCHSPELRANIGTELTEDELEKLIAANDGVTCVCFMGEGNDKVALWNLITYIKENHPNIKIGLYSGREDVPEDFYWDNLNYIKIGPYISELGPLNKETTNQRLYMGGKFYSGATVVNGVLRKTWTDITSNFWKR